MSLEIIGNVIPSTLRLLFLFVFIGIGWDGIGILFNIFCKAKWTHVRSCLSSFSLRYPFGWGHRIGGWLPCGGLHFQCVLICGGYRHSRCGRYPSWGVGCAWLSPLQVHEIGWFPLQFAVLLSSIVPTRDQQQCGIDCFSNRELHVPCNRSHLATPRLPWASGAFR